MTTTALHSHRQLQLHCFVGCFLSSAVAAAAHFEACCLAPLSTTMTAPQEHRQLRFLQEPAEEQRSSTTTTTTTPGRSRYCWSEREQRDVSSMTMLMLLQTQEQVGQQVGQAVVLAHHQMQRAAGLEEVARWCRVEGEPERLTPCLCSLPVQEQICRWLPWGRRCCKNYCYSMLQEELAWLLRLLLRFDLPYGRATSSAAAFRSPSWTKADTSPGCRALAT